MALSRSCSVINPSTVSPDRFWLRGWLQSDMNCKRIRVRPVAAAVSFTEISPSKRPRRRKCTQQRHSPRGITLLNNSIESSGSPRSESEIEESSGIDLATQDTCSSRSYLQRQEKLCDAWSQIRENLLTALIESSVPKVGTNCRTCNQVAVIICQQCGPQAVYCEECTESLHLACNIFHHPHLLQVLQHNSSSA